jgi:hypothetical protein
MIPKPKEKAIKLVSMNELIVLAEIGHKLTMDERVGIAKRQAIETCNEILVIMNEEYFSDSHKIEYWQEVKKEIESV